MGALETPSSAPRGAGGGPTGWPVSMYSSISARRMAALRSSMFTSPDSTDAGAAGGMLDRPSAGRMDSQEPGGGLVGQEATRGGEDHAVAAALGQTVGDER